MNKILFAYPEVSPIFPNGGIGTFIFEVSNLLSASGRWEVDILTDTSYSQIITLSDFRNAEKMFNDAGIRIFDLERNKHFQPGWDSPDITRAERYHTHVARLHAARNYDIIEFPDWRAPGFFTVRHKRTTQSFPDAQMVVHLHSSTKNVLDWQGGRFLSRNDLYCNYMEDYVKKYSDIVLSPSSFLLKSLHQTQHLPEKQMHRSGYPISSRNESPSRNVLNDRCPRPLTIACISRLELRKGQDIMASAIKHLAQTKSINGNVRFVFCGKDDTGLDRDGLMSKSIGRILSGVENWEIIAPKSRVDLLDWLEREVDICIVPSRVDNYPYVVMEASRAGCYVVASDAGGIPEIFKDYNLRGARFAPKDYHALGQEIQKAILFIRNNPGVRAVIAEEFEKSRQNQIQRTLKTYDGMVEKSNKYISSSLTEKAMPQVSIIITFYNDHRYAADAIRSAFASDYPNFEVILVNDGSDEPKSIGFLGEIEREYPQMKIIHKSNGGLGDARNAGLKVASGEFIVPLDSDNIILPNLLSSCVRVLTERENLSYVTTYFECLKEDDGARLPWQLSPVPKPMGAVDGLILLEPTPGDALALIRRSALESVGGYSTSIYCMEDWDLWLKFHEKRMEGDVIPDVHFIYRLRSNSMSRSLDALSGVRLQQSLLRNHEELVKDHSIVITTLLLQEYWNRWRGPDEAWRALLDILRRAINDPKPALSYLAHKFWLKIGESLSSNPVISKLVRAIRSK